jgi:hypothetical protein
VGPEALIRSLVQLSRLVCALALATPVLAFASDGDARPATIDWDPTSGDSGLRWSC